MRLILIRHGQTTSNVGHHLDTADPGADLTDLGRAQAEALVDTLVAEQIRAVYASTLVRTQQTATPLARALGLPIRIDARLREIGAGDLEMSNTESDVRHYLRTALGWANGAHATRMPGGTEDGTQTLSRFDAAIAAAVAAVAAVEHPATLAVVSHAAIIRVWAAARAANASDFGIPNRPISNTGAVVLVGEPHHWTIEQWHEPALGGPAVDDEEHDGPAADTLP